MEKKNKKGLIILVLLLVAIISGTFAVTFSRYYSSIDGTGEGAIAKWEVLVDGLNIETYNEEYLLNDCTWDNSNTGTDVATGMMAPGSVCYLQIQIQNNSEVDIDVDAQAGDVKINDVVTDLGITAIVDTTQSVTHINRNETGIVTLKVEWAIGGDGTTAADASDTTAGTNAADPNQVELKTAKFDVSITAQQHVD